MTDFDVRRITADDWEQYRTLRLEALQDSPLAFVEQYAESSVQPDEFWQERAERNATSPESTIFVAVRDGSLVAKAGCFVEPEVTDYVSAHVVGVYVTPALRGLGMAEALMEAVIRWAQEEPQADRIRLYVLKSNDRAAAFYRRFGFVPTGVTIAYPPDPTHTELEMEYQVARDS